MIKTFVIQILNLISSILSIIVVRDEKWVLCGGWFGKRFSDNSKAMYLYLFENKERLGLRRVVFATRSELIYQELKGKGYDVCKIGSLQSKFIHLKAKYHIIDQSPLDIERLWSTTAVRINLWHGFPLKRIGNQVVSAPGKEENSFLRRKRSVLGHWENYYNLVLSDTHKTLQKFAFNLSEEQMIIGMYPRISYMFGNLEIFRFSFEKEIMANISFSESCGKKIIGYFPTFRDMPDKNSQCIRFINEIENWLEENNCCLITKMHFASGLINEPNGKKIIINLPPECDVNSYLSYCSILITDYSSVYFDYLLLNRPVIFYAFDLDYYLNADRGFNFDYHEFAPGNISQNLDEVKEDLRNILQNSEEYQAKFEKIRTDVINTVYNNNIDPSVDSLDQLWFKITKIACEKSKK